MSKITDQAGHQQNYVTAAFRGGTVFGVGDYLDVPFPARLAHK
jgi:hypothetical protein